MPLEKLSNNNRGRALKIIFLGTAEFAIPSLRSVLDSRHETAAVVTKSDRPSGRGRREKPTPVKLFLREYSPQTPLIQPDKLKDPEFHRQLAEYDAELFVVACFPILPMKVVRLPKTGCLNIHPSLLPRYRGAAPIRWTLMNGDETTGVTTFFIGERVDGGSVLLQRETPIAQGENYGSLEHRLAEMGADLALESLDIIAAGEIHTKIQDESTATPAPKIRPEHKRVDWNRSALKIHNHIRAFAPKPGVFTFLNGRRLKIFASEPYSEMDIPLQIGKIDGEKLFAGCGEGALELLELQIEGRKRLPVKNFLRGFRNKEFRFE